MEKVELFAGAWRFSAFWMAIDILCLLHFLIAWIINLKKTGWKIDFWFFTLGLSFLIPVLFMYPFNASLYNMLACGSSYRLLEPEIDRAFAITLLGYCCLWLGRFLYRLFRWQTPFYVFVLLFRPYRRIVESNVKSKKVVLCLFFLTLAVSGVIFSIQINEGFFFNPRAFFLKNDVLRPIFNLGVSMLPFTITFLALRAIQYKENLSKALLVFLILLTVLFGLRSLTIGSIITVLIYRIFASSGKVSFFKLGCYGVSLALLAVYLDALRYGEFDFLSAASKLLISVFYGNNLSDTRDFAWILAYWDGEYVYGKTYLAGLISFFPRFISSFRQEWSFAIYTNALVDFDPTVHAGLRPGMFGEAFFNFSYAGVIVLGLAAGYLLRHVDIKLKEAVALRKDLIHGYSHTVIYAFISSFFITAGLWGFYTFVFLNLLLYPLSKLRLRYASLYDARF